MKRRTQKKPLMAADLTPLIDVVFLLLIFFMLVTTFDKYAGFKLELPTATNLESSTPKDEHELIIEADGTYHFKFGKITEKITTEDFVTKFKNAEEVVITADKKLTYETIVKSINELKNSGIEKVELNLNE